mgnify:CR=1 FL=1
MRPGDTVWVRVHKADGRPHRWWQATVEAVEGDCVITVSPAGSPIHHDPQRFPAALYALEHAIRAYYWPGRRYDVMELYEPDGRLVELYADITSPVAIAGGEIHYIDHELDVSQMAGEAPRIVDQDEFAEAAAVFGYTDEFMGHCYALAHDLLTVLANWTPAGPF